MPNNSDILNLIQNHTSQDPEQAELLNKAMQGREAFDYISGNKKKEVETYYDKHPIQATLQDTINKLPGLAAAGIGANTAHRAYKRYSLDKKYNNERLGVSSSKEKGKDGGGSKSKLFPSAPPEDVKSTRPDINNLWDDNHGIYEHFDNLGKVKPHLQDLEDGELERFLSKHHPKNLENPATQEELQTVIKNLTHRVGSGEMAGRVLQNTKSPGRAFMQSARSLMDTKFNRGAAIAGGVGLGLAPLINMVQKHYYGEPQVKEWLKNKRQTEGNFSE